MAAGDLQQIREGLDSSSIRFGYESEKSLVGLKLQKVDSNTDSIL